MPSPNLSDWVRREELLFVFGDEIDVLLNMALEHE